VTALAIHLLYDICQLRFVRRDTLFGFGQCDLNAIGDRVALNGGDLKVTGRTVHSRVRIPPGDMIGEAVPHVGPIRRPVALALLVAGDAVPIPRTNQIWVVGVVARRLVAVDAVHPVLRAIVNRLRRHARGVANPATNGRHALVVVDSCRMTAQTGAAIVDGMVVVGLAQIGYLDHLLILPTVVAATAVLPAGDGMRGTGSLRHAGGGVTHTTIGVVVLHVVGGQQGGTFLSRAVAGDAILEGYTLLLHIVRDGGLGKGGRPHKERQG
jgi:hypothetical protein